MSVLWLLGDALVVLCAASLAWRGLAAGATGLIDQLLGWGVMFFVLVAGSGVLLGATGGLAWSGFVLTHLGILGAGLGLRRRHLPADWRAGVALFSETLAIVRKERAAFYAASVLVIFIAATGVLAALAEPVVYDALTYRLSRVGHWLQEGRMGFIPGNDPRQNYMPVVPDLVMTWLVSAWAEGFRGAALAQWGGGVLLLIATAGLGRVAGLSRPAALGAALLLGGMANVVPQFTTVHTDLFTAGMLAAAYCLWHNAARRGEGSWLAGIGGALALGAKGTVFYLGPTLLLWAVWSGWQLRLSMSAWGRTMLAMIVSAAVFALPGFIRNWQNYGGVFGPREFVAMHHQAAGGQLLKKTGLNLGTSLLQVFEPNSQPLGLQGLARFAVENLAEELPQQDPFSYENLNRRETLQTIVQRQEPDADATSFGVLILGMFLFGAASALRSSRIGAADIRLWSAGVGVFFLFFHALQQWHPYGFRYFVLVAPWMAVISAWWLKGLTRAPGRTAWTLVMVAAGVTAGQVLLHTHQAGWQAVAQPERARNFYVYRAWRAWAGGLGREDEPWQVLMPFNRPLAAFYRTTPTHPVHPRTESAASDLTAEQALQKFDGGWLIVPALRFMGREGRVSGSVWLYEGDPESPFSVAAYHKRAAGEIDRPLVYRHLILRDAGLVRHELLVRAGDDGRVSLHLQPTGDIHWRFSITTPTEQRRGECSAEPAIQTLVLPPGQVAEVRLSFEPIGKNSPLTPGPSVEIRR